VLIAVTRLHDCADINTFLSITNLFVATIGPTGDLPPVLIVHPRLEHDARTDMFPVAVLNGKGSLLDPPHGVLKIHGILIALKGPAHGVRRGTRFERRSVSGGAEATRAKLIPLDVELGVADILLRADPISPQHLTLGRATSTQAQVTVRRLIAYGARYKISLVDIIWTHGITPRAVLTQVTGTACIATLCVLGLYRARRHIATLAEGALCRCDKLAGLSAAARRVALRGRGHAAVAVLPVLDEPVAAEG